MKFLIEPPSQRCDGRHSAVTAFHYENCYKYQKLVRCVVSPGSHHRGATTPLRYS